MGNVDSADSSVSDAIHRQVQEEARTLGLARAYINEYEARSQDRHKAFKSHLLSAFQANINAGHTTADVKTREIQAVYWSIKEFCGNPNHVAREAKLTLMRTGSSA